MTSLVSSSLASAAPEAITHASPQSCRCAGHPPSSHAFWLHCATQFGVAAACAIVLAHAQAAALTGLQRNAVFRTRAPLARNDALLRRLRSPLQALRIEQSLPGNSDTLHAWPLDPAQQQFALYVPPGPPPPSGYGLLVFVPPWNDAIVPLQWISALDRNHTVFISAAHSGNDANVLDRRVPLALSRNKN